MKRNEKFQKIYLGHSHKGDFFKRSPSPSPMEIPNHIKPPPPPPTPAYKFPVPFVVTYVRDKKNFWLTPSAKQN